MNRRGAMILLVLAMSLALLTACASQGEPAVPASPPTQENDVALGAPPPTIAPTPIPTEVVEPAPADTETDDAPTAETPAPITRGMLAPDFTLLDLDGNPRTLSAFRGQVVMLNFWASWCGFCRSEIPHMNTVYTELADEGFEILAVSLGEDPDHLREFAAEYEMEFPILADVDGETVPLYWVRSVPTSFFIDRDGRIQDAYGGAIAEDTLRTMVRALLDGS